MIQMNCMYRTLLAAVALAFSSVTASAETITVCASGCDDTSINAAIGAASDGDVIQLAAETYFEGSQIDTVGKAITLRGVLDKAGEPASVLDGGGTHRVLICQSGETVETVFLDLVIQNGYIGGDGGGGGMYNDSSSPTMADCTFAGNLAESYGGGMYNYDSSPALANCTFTGNSADDSGGGMYNDQSSPTLTDCTFTSNSARYRGGGMRNYRSSPTLTNCTFTNNSAGGGGGMLNFLSSPTLADCTFTGNSAESYGGGMGNVASSSTLTDCTFTNNLAESGGGMYNTSSSSPTLTDCTFTNNSAYYSGGGMGNSPSSSPTLTDCTFAECCQVDPPRSFIDLGGNDYDSWCDDCRADVNCRDNAVNAADLGILIGSWGTNDPQCDINGDGTVSAADLGLLIGAWGPCQ